MSIWQLLILQFISHLLTDFIFQSEKMAIGKNSLNFKGSYLKWHVLITFVTSWLVSFQINFIFAAFVIAFFHWLIDGIKKHVENHGKMSRYAFFIDQILHIVIILSTVLLFNKIAGLNPIVEITPGVRPLLIIAGYIVCAKPANIFIRQILKAFDIELPSQGNEELPNAGKLIGITERFLVFTFIIVNQFEAVGFLIAAKSILRFKEDNTVKTEYVLIGTMLSFGIAITSGIITNLT